METLVDFQHDPRNKRVSLFCICNLWYPMKWKRQFLTYENNQVTERGYPWQLCSQTDLVICVVMVLNLVRRYTWLCWFSINWTDLVPSMKRKCHNSIIFSSQAIQLSKWQLPMQRILKFRHNEMPVSTMRYHRSVSISIVSRSWQSNNRDKTWYCLIFTEGVTYC